MASKENDPEPMHGKSNVRTLTDTTFAALQAGIWSDLFRAKTKKPGHQSW
jgi:hypothetical protein